MKNLKKLCNALVQLTNFMTVHSNRKMKGNEMQKNENPFYDQLNVTFWHLIRNLSETATKKRNKDVMS